MTDRLNVLAPTERPPRHPSPNERRPGDAPQDRLTRAVEERRLFARYRQRDDPAARAALVERFLPLAKAAGAALQRWWRADR